MYCKNVGCLNRTEEGSNTCSPCKEKLRKKTEREKVWQERQQQAESDSLTTGKFTTMPLSDGKAKGQAVPHGQGLGKKRPLTKEEKTAKEQRRKELRQKRLAAQPKRGKSDGSGKNQYKKKGGDKKKKK